ncbi:MAG: hypothetical protein ACREE6_04285, partial [Limisphaerales bacterium]
AQDGYPQMVMLGDRNIGTATVPPANGINMTGGWALGMSAGTGHGVSTYSPGPSWAWSANDIHLKVGNIGLADGSVQETSASALQTALAYATNGTPWAIQYFNFPN